MTRSETGAAVCLECHPDAEAIRAPPVDRSRCPELDHMERPTSALHLARITLSLRQLGAEPHTKEVGRDEVYNHRGVRSARRYNGGRGGAARPAHTRAAATPVGHGDDYPVHRAPPPTGSRAVLLRSGSMRLRAPACLDRATDSM